MKVLIIGLNYAPENVGIAVYTTGMAEALQRRGHQVQVIAGQPYYPAWRVTAGYSRWGWTRSVVSGADVTRVPHYVPAKPTGVRRLLHHASFAFSACFPAIFRAWLDRPDVVIAVAPSLAAAPIARLAARLSGTRAWLHLQDFEVESAFATGLLRPDSSIGKLARRFERAVIGGFDTVSSISPQMCRKLAAKGISPERIVEFRNWADVLAITPLPGPSPFRAEWRIGTPHVALYSGSIGNKQGLEIILAAAQRLAHRTDLSFVICGEGPNRRALEARAAGLGNVQFQDLQPKERLNDLLGLASVHLLPQLSSAADLVLPSKLTHMLASGRPVIATAVMGTGLADEVDGCGLLTPPDDILAFAAAIERVLDDRDLHAKLSVTARRRAEERWNGHLILAGFEHRLLNLARSPEPALTSTP